MPKKVDINDVELYSAGRLQLIAGLCEKMGVTEIFNKELAKHTGRPPDIPPGIEAAILIAGICVDEGYRPLYAIKDYYEYKDLEGIFHHPLELSQLNDDRFGSFLDDFAAAGPRNIFQKISAEAFFKYGIVVRKINYDTTSKIMWGEYESPDLPNGAIKTFAIDFGHSKQNRGDKKQIKIAIGTANGVVADAKVLSGNMDDKTYNKDNLEDVDRLLQAMKIDRASFYYIADSALFTEENIKKTTDKKINFITRIPDNIKEAKELLDKPLEADFQTVFYTNKMNKEVKYQLTDTQITYKGYDLKTAVIYSEELQKSKSKTVLKKVDKERILLNKLLKKYNKRPFACEADAVKEIAVLEQKKIAKLSYHDVNFAIVTTEKHRPGRRSLKNPGKNLPRQEYHLNAEIMLNDEKIANDIRRESTFLLCSNDLSLSGEEILREYKTQSDVEKRFKALKAPSFMNSLFLKTPSRVEALVYILLICLMILTVAERVVRDNLKKDQAVLLGTEKRKIKAPTFNVILKIMDRVRTIKYVYNGKTVREIRNIDESSQRIIKYLGLPESCFAWNSG